MRVDFRTRIVIGGLVCVGMIALSQRESFAAPGVFEINQACAEAGCFPGDAPGFPVEIVSPGSYRLVGNLAKPLGDNGAIQVSTSDVTIDMQGFSITGQPRLFPSDQPGDGIASTFLEDGFTKRITVRNGTLRDLRYGVSLGRDATIQNVTALNNRFGGFYLESGRVHDSTMIGGNDGITLLYGGEVVRCRIIGAFNGIQASLSSLRNGRVRISDSLFSGSENTALRASSFPLEMHRVVVRSSLRGIAGPTALIEESFVDADKAVVALGEPASRVTNSWIEGDTNGLRLGDNARVQGNFVRNHNGIGIEGGEGCALLDNVVRGCGGSGIFGQAGTTASGNVSSGNTDDGIFANAKSNVHGNVTQNNEGHGISVNAPSRVVGNVSVDNTRNGLRMQTAVGYGENVLGDNDEGDVSGGQSLSVNLCGGSPCP